MTDTITIIGCGLIGGSIGLALKKSRPDWRLCALDVPENETAIQNANFADFVGTVKDAQVLFDSRIIILAAPVEIIFELLEQIAPHLASGTIVTDVGGTKAAIARRAAQVLPKNVAFIGGHPIAGSEETGIRAAQPLLFKGRVYALCPESDTPAPALLELLDLIEDLHALPLTIEPEEHDRILAMVSHMPQLLSIALMNAAIEEDSSHNLLKSTIGTGFLDVTRIALSDYAQWKGVLETNWSFISASLKQLEQNLVRIRTAWKNGKLGDLWQSVSTARRAIHPTGSARRGQPGLRDRIDEYDERLLRVLGDRMRAAKQIGDIKREKGALVYDPHRERSLLIARRQWGQALGLSDELIDELFEVLLRHSKKMQVTEPR